MRWKCLGAYKRLATNKSREEFASESSSWIFSVVPSGSHAKIVLLYRTAAYVQYVSRTETLTQFLMTLEASLDAILSHRVCGDGPGVQVVLISPNGVIYEGARGLANPIEDSDEKVHSKYQANLYSVSKFFTACCILKLIEQKKISRTDKVYRNLPVKLRELVNKECTIEQLVAHASGAPNPLPLQWVHRPDETIDETEILARVLKTHSFKAKPLPFYYSNVGYWLLGFVVTTTCNLPNFAQCCQELLFSKLDEDFYISDHFSPSAPMAYGHLPCWSGLALMAKFVCPKSMIGPANTKWIRMEPHLIDGVGYGGLVGSSRSVSAFLQSLLSGKVLDSTEPLFMPLLNAQMTFGLHIRSHRGLRIYHKEGGGAGCHSTVQFRRELAGCIIAGDATFDVNGLMDELMDCIEDDSSKIRPTTLERQVLARDGTWLHTRHYSMATHQVASSSLTSNECVLLISGGPGVPDYLQDLAALLIKSNITSSVLCFDQRGVGNSPYTGEITMDHLLNDIHDIQKAFNLKTIHIVGHSWGGVPAQLYAQRLPHCVSSLVLLSPTTVSQASDWSQMEKEVMKYNREKGGWIHFVSLGIWSLLVTWIRPFVSNFAARRLMTHVIKNYYYDPTSAPDPSQCFLLGISAHAMIQSTRAFLTNVTEPMTWDEERIPSYCIFGDEDIYGQRMMEAFCAGFKGKTDILPQCSHLSWLDQPRRLVCLLKNFYGTKRVTK